MTVLRINKKERNFLVIDKTCLGQSNLSWGAKGLHAFLMGLRDDCRISVEKLRHKATNGRDSVRGLINELKECGYITTEWVRNESTGKYSSLEYIVHELPQAIEDVAIRTSSPETEKPSPDIQAPDYPSTANTTPININNNNKDLKNNQVMKTAAGNGEQTTQPDLAAAIFSQHKKKEDSKSQEIFPKSFSPEDSVIGNELTSNQLDRLYSLVEKLTAKSVGVDKAQLFKEIQYCLLNPNHFKSCGLDFGRKLNAIRTVILRGDWQTPAGMVIEETKRAYLGIQELEKELMDAHSEVSHFEWLQSIAKEHVQGDFDEIVQKGKRKILHLEEKMQHAYQPLDAQMF